MYAQSTYDYLRIRLRSFVSSILSYFSLKLRTSSDLYFYRRPFRPSQPTNSTELPVDGTCCSTGNNSTDSGSMVPATFRIIKLLHKPGLVLVLVASI